MKDKEYHVANFATFVSKTLIFSPKNGYMDQTSSVLHQQNIWTNQVLFLGDFKMDVKQL